MTALAIILICALSSVEMYCFAWIVNYIQERSDERTEQRRAMYRARAYSAVKERRIICQNRQATWRAFGNGKI